MKYCVDIREAASGSLEGDNLHGEQRWERQVARALLDSGREVGAVRNVWGNPDTTLWRGEIRDLRGHTLISYADPGTTRYRPGADVFITNVFCGLTDTAEREIRQAISDMGRNRVALTHSFQVHVALKRLPPDLHDLIRWLPVPAVPHVHWDNDPFPKKVLLWSARAIHFRLIQPHQTIIDLLDWIRARLVEDPEMRFEVLASEMGLNQSAAEKWVWGFPPFEAAFKDVRSQVVIHPSLSWSQVQAVFSRTKMCVNDPTAFGGPPLEAASFGIPVACPVIGLFSDADASAPEPAYTATAAFPEMTVWGGVGSPDYVDQLDKWFHDRDAFHSAGKAYREYVDRTYTYAAFVRHLDALPVYR